MDRVLTYILTLSRCREFCDRWATINMSGKTLCLGEVVKYESYDEISVIFEKYSPKLY